MGRPPVPWRRSTRKRRRRFRGPGAEWVEEEIGDASIAVSYPGRSFSGRGPRRLPQSHAARNAPDPRPQRHPHPLGRSRPLRRVPGLARCHEELHSRVRLGLCAPGYPGLRAAERRCNAAGPQRIRECARPRAGQRGPSPDRRAVPARGLRRPADTRRAPAAPALTVGRGAALLEERREGERLGERQQRARRLTAEVFRYTEHLFYVGVAVALVAAGLALFAAIIHAFYGGMRAGNVSGSVLPFLDGLLLVFIISEIIHTVRAVVAENVLTAEPFLIVGIVAAIRRLIVASAAAKEHLGRAEFTHLMLEIGVLGATVVALGFTIYLLRHTTRSEPRPEHEGRGRAGQELEDRTGASRLSADAALKP